MHAKFVVIKCNERSIVSRASTLFPVAERTRLKLWNKTHVMADIIEMTVIPFDNSVRAVQIFEHKLECSHSHEYNVRAVRVE